MMMMMMIVMMDYNDDKDDDDDDDDAWWWALKTLKNVKPNDQTHEKSDKIYIIRSWSYLIGILFFFSKISRYFSSDL